MNTCCWLFSLRTGILVYAYVFLAIYTAVIVFGAAIGVVMFVKQTGDTRRSVALPESVGAEELSDVPFINDTTKETSSSDVEIKNERKYNTSKLIKSDSKWRSWSNPFYKNHSRHKPHYRDDWEVKLQKRKMTKDKKSTVGIVGFSAMGVCIILLIILFFLLCGIHKEKLDCLVTYIVLKTVILTVLFIGAAAVGFAAGAAALILLPFLLFETYMLFIVYDYFDATY